MSTLSHVSRSELGERPVSEVAVRGKELQLRSSVGEARRLLSRRAVKIVPVLNGGRYVGCVDRDLLAGIDDEVALGALVASVVPVMQATTPIHEALDVLDADGGLRLAVVDEHGSYVGIVCLRADRLRLCVDRERLGSRPPAHAR